LLELVGQPLDVVTAPQGVDGVGHAGLGENHLLRAQGDGDGFLGGERVRLVEGVGVQGLRAPQHRRHGLQGDPHDVVVRLLRGE
jgi:hypothetical protein